MKPFNEQDKQTFKLEVSSLIGDCDDTAALSPADFEALSTYIVTAVTDKIEACVKDRNINASTVRRKPAPIVKEPAFTDESLCPINGKYQGVKMYNVPASYLEWCKEQPWFNSKYPQVAEYLKPKAKGASKKKASTPKVQELDATAEQEDACNIEWDEF